VIGFGILWFFISLAVESTFVPIRDPMNEHRMYLAMPGVSFALASIFVWSAERWSKLTWAIGTAFAALLCIVTFARNEAWRTQRALWQDALRKSPGKARVHVNYGTALHLDGDLDEAIEHYCKALEIEPANRRARSNINLAQQEQIDRGEAAVEIRQQADGTIVGIAIDPCPP
jgi:tetratricopeptide (TPR) repeat protein